MNLEINDIDKCQEMKEVNVSRRQRKNINDKIEEFLKGYVVTNDLEDSKCYLVKNVIEGTDMVFVHEYECDKKSFKNIDKSLIQGDFSEGDVLIIKNGKLVADSDVSNKLENLKQDIAKEINDLKEMFEIEGREYVVCDKSDDDILPTMNIRIEEIKEELWGIKISKELYKKIRYGSKVKFLNGEYICEEAQAIE